MNSFELIEYRSEFKNAIKELNIEWLEKYFELEPNDIVQPSYPEKEILYKGGKIYYAKYLGEIVGTFSLLKLNDDTFELGKMAVTDRVQGLGIGNFMMEQCLLIATEMVIKKLILYSNTKLASAIHLYKKFGFVEVPMEAGHYKRSNIKMEKIIFESI
ncbi:MAG: GNAT family N-acetyltransferase [Bacteroidota bacterium]|nr:GNAT family N-acetyltransferase [Bacteroidota bacterium]